MHHNSSLALNDSQLAATPTIRNTFPPLFIYLLFFSKCRLLMSGVQSEVVTVPKYGLRSSVTRCKLGLSAHDSNPGEENRAVDSGASHEKYAMSFTIT